MQAIEAGMPPYIVDDAIGRWVDVKYRGDESSTDKFDVIAAADRLMSVPSMDILAGVSAGQYFKWEKVLHESAGNIYDHLTDTDASFSNKNRVQKVVAMIERAKEVAEGKARAPITAKLGVVRDMVAPATEGESVQDTALNGAQIASLVEIINQVSAQIITIETARPLIEAAFPGIDRSLVDSMLAGVEKKEAQPIPITSPVAANV